MSLIPTPSQAEQDLALLDNGILQVAEALNHAAARCKSAQGAVAGLPIDRFLAVLNADKPRTQAILDARARIGAAINAELDALGLDKYSNRAPVDLGVDGISFDGQDWIYTAPEVPEEPAP
jgi:hypothetical protein